ncbi:MAG: hypothetical protein ACI9HU_001995 [Colwellia sp.]|jgi:hypothetical protein
MSLAKSTIYSINRVYHLLKIILNSNTFSLLALYKNNTKRESCGYYSLVTYRNIVNLVYVLRKSIIIKL